MPHKGCRLLRTRCPEHAHHLPRRIGRLSSDVVSPHARAHQSGNGGTKHARLNWCFRNGSKHWIVSMANFATERLDQTSDTKVARARSACVFVA